MYQSDLRLIGQLTLNWHAAEEERRLAKAARGKARGEHPCTGEVYRDGDTAPEPCWYRPYNTDDWCEGCQYVQPFYVRYMAAAQKANTAHTTLTKTIRKMNPTSPDGQEGGRP